ncbi:ATPase [candidate division GN15 bacterium]|uniref:ATPase n=1 Tax=candidate division GN15 bacterium TaxID=2072418 RepID=A0A855X7H7_9BACT|nr:MAG: ATPase [candidate division GN15 bacterium]
MTTHIDLSTIKGLSDAEAYERLLVDGYNELPSSRKRSVFAIALGVVREPMFLLLVACGSLYLILGDFQEASMLLGFVVVVMGITLYQERKSERALEALRDLASPRASVIRGGEQKRIAGRDVVVDDIVVLHEGDRVPADATLMSCINLSADESLLTGESVAVRKSVWDGKSETVQPGGDDLPYVFSGTMIVQGQGIARVHATGVRTEIGKIGKALQTVEMESTPLQKETGRLVRNLAIVGVSLCVLVVVVYGLTRHDWLNGFLAGITLAMATLPEEFPVVLTIFLALGAWRLSQKQVLTRHVPAVETLGSATVLCVDKTGTLTQNRMTVKKIVVDGTVLEVENPTVADLPEAFHEIVEFSILASKRDPFDPMERAFKQLGDTYLADTEHLHADWHLVQEYPLSKELLALSHVWQSPGGNEFIIAAKGAPEAIFDLCHLDEVRARDLEGTVTRMASEGLRVLGVARAGFSSQSLPEIQHDFAFSFLGLVGLADPIRATVPSAIKECYAAGIRVIMITGDYPGTAKSIGREIGLSSDDNVITGPELERMTDKELQVRIRDVDIFARVVPEQKLRLVNALKANGEVVAMTGDGVNDAPALKSAHIGIAMGGRGTDVARESSSLVLLDDDFSSIVGAVRLGRRIFDNIKKAMAYIVSVHVPIAGMSFIPVVMQWPLVLLPMHIVFLELIIDPACSVVFEAEGEEANVMRRPPRVPNEPLFGKNIIWISLLQGISALAVVLAVFLTARYMGQSEEGARTFAVVTLIFSNLALILTNRSWTRTVWEMLRSRNAALLWVLGGTIAFVFLILYMPFLRSLFRFSVLHPVDLLLCVLAAAVSILWFEALKLIGRRRVASAQ